MDVQTLDRLAALAAAAPDDVMCHTIWGDRASPAPQAGAFYDAMKQAAPALIAAAREREALAALLERALDGDTYADIVQGELADFGISDQMRDGTPVREVMNAASWHILEQVYAHLNAIRRALAGEPPCETCEGRGLVMDGPTWATCPTCHKRRDYPQQMPPSLCVRLARAVRAQASVQAAATRSDSASWLDFVSADVARLLEEVGDGDE